MILKSLLPALGIGLILTGLTACQHSDSAYSNTDEWQDISDTGLPYAADESAINNGAVLSVDEVGQDESYSLPTPAVKAVEIDRSAEQVAEQMVESLALSQAKLAAKRRDQCPKLLSPEVDSELIQRSEEVLKGDYCDYYIYPFKGDVITVSSQPNSIKSSLISPIQYDFANGAYQVEHSDKHIIRVYYAGSEFRIHPLNYDVVVAIQ